MSTITRGGQPSAAERPTSDGLAPAVVLVPMLNLGHAQDMLQLAAMMIKPGSLAPGENPASSGASGVPQQLGSPRIVVLSVVEVPADQPLTMGLDMARSYRALLDFLPSEVEVEGRNVRVDRVVKVARDVAAAIHQAAYDERADIVLMYWKGHAREPRRRTYGKIIDATLKSPPCSVMLVRMEGWRKSRRVLLPVRGGPSAEQALDVGMALAQHARIPLAVLHNVPPKPVSPEAEDSSLVEALGEEPYIIFYDHLRQVQAQASVPVESVLTRREDPVDALLAEAQSDDLVIMGLPAPADRSEQAGEGEGGISVALRVSKEKGAPLLLLRTPAAIDLAAYTRKVKAGRSRKRWLDMPFEHWFVEHTFHGDEFRDPEEFLKAKQAAGLTLSIALITSNDARAVHSAVTGLRKVLVEMHPVADQIAVIDAGSTDGTADVARQLGADVYEAADILPGQGALHGRGECWWKSLAVLRGDIVVWLDVRARRFHPSTALSLAGPLLRVPTLQLVKAFGQIDGPEGHREKPGRQEADEFSLVDMSWGGFVVPRREAGGYAGQVRVQALKPADLESLSTAQIAMLPLRTLVQVLAPGLAGVVAPFGRDLAARREAMLSLPVFAGENLELGLLLSAAAEYGTNAIAQIELRQGQPGPPPAPGLRNAMDVLQVLSRRLPEGQFRKVASSTAERLQKELEGRRPSPGDAVPAIFEVRALGPVERPPMNTALD